MAADAKRAYAKYNPLAQSIFQQGQQAVANAAPQFLTDLTPGNSPISAQISQPYTFNPSPDRMEYAFVDSPSPTPEIGSDVPGGATPYNFGDISMAGNTRKFIDVYETDSSDKVIGFVELTIDPSDISAARPCAAASTANSGGVFTAGQHPGEYANLDSLRI